MAGKKIKSGDLRHPVILLQPAAPVGVHDEDDESYTPVATVYADRQDVSGRQFYLAHAVDAENTVTFTIRWRNDIDRTWRIQHGTEVFNILEINHLGYMRDYLRLKCQNVQDGGA